MTRSLPRYYKKITILSTILSTFGALLYSYLVYIPLERSAISTLYFLFVHLVYSISYSIIISITCLLIFLCGYEKFNKNQLLRVCAWFLTPFLFMLGVILYEINYGLKTYGKITPEFGYPLLFFIVFGFTLIVSYQSYIKEL